MREKEKFTYSVSANFRQEEKIIIAQLQAYYINRDFRKVNIKETLRLAALDAYKLLKIEELLPKNRAEKKKKASSSVKPEASKKIISNTFQATGSSKEGFLTISEIKEMLSMTEISDNKLAKILKDLGFLQKRTTGARGWLVKTKTPNN